MSPLPQRPPPATVTVRDLTNLTSPTVAASGASGARAYASVKARPYQRGALVRVQARRPGASSWKTFGSRSVSSNGAARAGFRLYARGTWQVRVVRVATTLRATGYRLQHRPTSQGLVEAWQDLRPSSAGR